MYKLINWFPFNNTKTGKVNICNEGAILIKCKIRSNGDNNTLKISAGGYSVIASL
jgi:hypothetical protein